MDGKGGLRGFKVAMFDLVTWQILHSMEMPPSPHNHIWFSLRPSSIFITSICGGEVVPTTLDMNIDFHIQATSLDNKAMSPRWCPHVFLTLIFYQNWVRNLIKHSKSIKRVRFGVVLQFKLRLGLST